MTITALGGPVATIMVSSQPYFSYVSESDAEVYMQGALHAQTGTPAWSSQTLTARNQSIITASRVLDRQRWLGTQVDPLTPQPLQWPRNGTGIALVDQNPTLIPQKICYACCEMALAIIQGSDLQTAQNQAQKIQSLAAGSARISYFRLAEGPPIRWPQIINELLRDYLAGSITNVSIAFGARGRSVTDQSFGLVRGM